MTVEYPPDIVPGGSGLPPGGTAGQVLGIISINPTVYGWVNQSGGVTSVFGRAGVVVAVANDYTVGQVNGAAPTASPTFTGTVTVPNQAPLDSSAKAANTAYVDAAVAALQGTLGSLAYETPSGTPGVNNFLRGDFTWAQQYGFVIFNLPTAAIGASAMYAPTAYAVTFGECYLSTETAPVTTALDITLRYTTNGGGTWTTIASLVIAAGSTTTDAVSSGVTVPSGAQIAINTTSVGSGGAATGVVVTGYYE